MDQLADVVSLSNQIEQLHKHTHKHTHTHTHLNRHAGVLYSHRVYLIRKVFGMRRSEPDPHFWIHLGTWETFVITILVELRKLMQAGHHGDFVQEVSKASSSFSGLVDSAESSAEERTVGGEGERDSDLREVAIAVDVLTQQRHLLHPLWCICAG